MSNIPYRISNASISLIVENKPTMIPKSHMNFDALRTALLVEDHNHDTIRSLADIPLAIALATSGLVSVYDGLVHYAGAPCHNYLAQRILQHAASGESFIPLMKMLEMMMLNPNEDIREDLFKWLEAGDMPLTEDGFIIGYKYVDNNYYSSYSGKNGPVLHAIGTTVDMPREECDESRNNTCSTGLHFCSFGYLGQYTTGKRILIMKVNPTHITAIPKDYSAQKARCCEYDVVGELAREDFSDHYRGKKTVDAEGSIEGVNLTPEGEKKAAKPTVAKEKASGKKKSAKTIDRETKLIVTDQLKGMKFKHAKSGKSYKAYSIWLKVSTKGQRWAATDTGVPRTTLQNWMTAINAVVLA